MACWSGKLHAQQGPQTEIHKQNFLLHMKRTIIMETWPRMKRIINTRKCEPDAAAAVVAPAGFWIASVGSSLMVIPPFQADWPPLAGEMPWDLAGGILQRGKKVGTDWKASQALRGSDMAKNPDPVHHTACAVMKDSWAVVLNQNCVFGHKQRCCSAPAAHCPCWFLHLAFPSYQLQWLL